MRRRMQELAAGVYEENGPKIKLSKERLELEIAQGEGLKGSFFIQSLNHVPMRGIVYSDNPRMDILEAEFSGCNAEICFEFHTDGLVEGDVQKGKFFIIANKNEYTLSFVVTTRHHVLEWKDRKIQSLDEFVQFAKEDYRKAYELFTNELFPEVIGKESHEIRLMARILSYEMAPLYNMEEFLVSTLKKSPVTYLCEYHDLEYNNLTEDVREIIEVQRNGWGYSNVKIGSDAEFIVFQKQEYGMDDFIGSSCRIPFFIDIQKLHAGVNYARITLQCEKTIFQYEVKVHQRFVERKDNDIRRTICELTRLYVDYRTAKVMPASYGQETLQKLEHILAINEENVLIWLAKAQTLLLSGRTQEAQWILDKYKGLKEYDDSIEYGYYLYVTTLLSNERSYVHKVATQLQRLYIKNQDNLYLFWMNLFVSEAFENSRIRKYNEIKQFCLKYSHSPILYAESFLLVKEKPELLDDFGVFEMRLIYWAFREGLLTKELGYYFVGCTRFNRNYYPLLIPVLKDFYNRWPEDEFLKALCFYLIGGQNYGRDDVTYYEQAIERQLMIHGLYEAYIIAAANMGRLEYPKMIQYYFQYKTNLSYRYKAFVYAGIIRNREKQTTLYLHSKPEIEEFALEQIELGHMDENLAQIYSLYLGQISITHELARGLAPLLYIHRLTCEEKKMQKVIVAHRQINKIMSYPIVGGVAYFPIYARDHVVAFEDGNGHRYIKSVDYDLMMLMVSDALTRKCMRLAPEQMPYLIHYFDYNKVVENQIKDMSDMELGYLNILLSSNAITEEYKLQLRPNLISYYHDTGRTQLLDEYLKSLDFVGLNQSIRIMACELLLERGFYEKAFQITVEYGCHGIAASYMLTLCSRMIEKFEGEANDYLIGLCTMVFEQGKFNEILLSYLAKYMYGSTKSMYQLWIHAHEFGVNTYELEERLLVQMLYTEEFVNNSEEIITSYISEGGKKLVLDAYVSYFAHQYFVRNTLANTLVMEQLLGMAKKGMKMHLCLRLALLKWLGERDRGEETIMQEIYDECILRDLRFQFFEQLPDKVTAHFPEKGKKVVEYRTDREVDVLIRYLHHDYVDQMNESEEYAVEQMKHMYGGIFVKEFTMFYGDYVQYYICEVGEDGEKIVCSGQISNRDISSRQDKDQYTMLNALIMSEQLGEHASFEKQLELYDELIIQAKKEFSWIK